MVSRSPVLTTPPAAASASATSILRISLAKVKKLIYYKNLAPHTLGVLPAINSQDGGGGDVRIRTIR